jgi:hypothetical protein
MHADDIAFAEGNDLKFGWRGCVTRLANHGLDGQGRTRRSVVLGSVVALENLARVTMPQG